MHSACLSGSTVFVSHYLINGKIFEKKLLNVKCVSFSLLLLSETFLVLIGIEGMCVGPLTKHPLFLSYFNDSRIFSTNF
jgi:hypothetical protein